jgi:hypothetical protein
VGGGSAATAQSAGRSIISPLTNHFSPLTGASMRSPPHFRVAKSFHPYSVHSNTMPSSKIIELRQVLAQRYPQELPPPSSLLATGIESLDRHLDGGLRRGSITQLVAPLPSCGSASLLHDLIESMQASSQFIALIDGKNSFEPLDVANLLLWIRCDNVSQAIRATDLIIRDGNIVLSILDLKQNEAHELRKVPATAWYRLQRVTAEIGTTLLLITSYYISGSSYAALQINNPLGITDFTELSSKISQSRLIDFIYRKNHHVEPQYAQA